MPRAIAVDWSGAKTGAARRIWIAEAVDGRLETLEGGRDRDAVVDWLCARRLAVPRAVVGIDFSFSYPAWFLDARGWRQPMQIWRGVAEHGEGWLADCPAPFWGRPGTRRGPEPQLRACEEGWSVRGIVPKSVFQIGGAGAVGTGTVRGIPHLPRLAAAGWAIWPYEPAGRHTVCEIWPRLLTGPVAKSRAADRRAWLRRHADLGRRLLDRAASSEDAFDAAASALRLSAARDLARALRTPPPGDPREGAMLVPPSLVGG
ncbi:MAG: hypothetical protein RL190_1039 [Actinomycetota bacterium]|jgi:hypothetical protein